MDVVCTNVLVDIFRLLSPRSLAASRCVCTSWRVTIDGHRLLRSDLLPLWLDAVIFTTIDPRPLKLFSAGTCTITSRIDYVDDRMSPWYDNYVLDCCNGLLLFRNHVVNPATRQSVRLPPFPRSCTVPDCMSYGCIHDLDRKECLVYDPAESPHYKVLLIPYIPNQLPSGHISKHVYCGGGGPVSEMEWPPSPYIIDVFSSKTKCWKERSFMREGEAAGTVADLKPNTADLFTYLYHTAYWHGALYAPCQEGFALRINLSNDKYRVFKLPKGNKGRPRLGKSKKGVYCTLIHGPCTAEVWFLDESSAQIKWVIRSQVNLEPSVRDYPWNPFEKLPWTVQSDDQAKLLLENEANTESLGNNNVTLVEDYFKWDAHGENTFDTMDWPREYSPNAPSFTCFGYHPYKEVVLFSDGHHTVIAYHMNSSRVVRLGWMASTYSEDIRVSFAYAPCWMRDLS